MDKKERLRNMENWLMGIAIGGTTGAMVGWVIGNATLGGIAVGIIFGSTFTAISNATKIKA